jgi:hypothetical protein
VEQGARTPFVSKHNLKVFPTLLGLFQKQTYLEVLSQQALLKKQPIAANTEELRASLT